MTLVIIAKVEHIWHKLSQWKKGLILFVAHIKASNQPSHRSHCKAWPFTPSPSHGPLQQILKSPTACLIIKLDFECSNSFHFQKSYFPGYSKIRPQLKVWFEHEWFICYWERKVNIKTWLARQQSNKETVDTWQCDKIPVYVYNHEIKQVTNTPVTLLAKWSITSYPHMPTTVNLYMEIISFCSLCNVCNFHL